MKKNIKLKIMYDGTDFHGWQRQTTKRSVQGEIERVLTKIAQVPVTIDGAGRTDAGVHAIGQVATFQAELPMCIENLKKVMNSYLGFDVMITDLNYEPEDFHARYSAKGKTYQYKVYNYPERDVFKSRTMYHYPYKLNDDLIQKACMELIGSHNFESFRAAGSSAQNPFRTITEIDFKRDGTDLTFTFTGDGFLYKMVRILVAFLLEIGNQRIELGIVREILTIPTRKYTSKVAPAKGLCLLEVYY